MESLFNIWKTKIPKYRKLNADLFEMFTFKGGADGEKKISSGKRFSNNYELYIYAFFLGLYENEFTPIGKEERRVDFSHPIQFWGGNTKYGRTDFSQIQQFIFMAVIAKSDVDVIGLDKGTIDVNDVVKELINTMESYTNGGLDLLRDKHESNPSYFLQATSFLDLIVK